MYRNFRSRGRSGRSVFRRRSPRRVRDVTEPKRWTASNFFIQHFLSEEAEAGYVAVATPLVAIASQYDAVFTQAQSLVFEQQARRMEVGGITFSMGWRPGINGQTGLVQQDVWSALYTDEVDIDGAPFYLPDFDTTRFPISTNPIESNTTWPTRVHWRWYGVLNATDPQDALDSNSYPIGIGAKNLRLRKAIDINQGLFLCSALRNAVDGPAFGVVTYAGTLYWRLRT